MPKKPRRRHRPDEVAQPPLFLRHIHIENKTASATTLSLYLDSGRDGRAWIWKGAPIAAKSAVDWYGFLRTGGQVALAVTLEPKRRTPRRKGR